MELPAAAVEDCKRILEPRRTPTCRPHLATLLVVDDNEDNRDVLSRRLQRKKGFQVLVAE